jgi:predicted dehydrogenase
MTATHHWGIAATGNIAASMAAALQTLPNARLVAVGSRSHDTATAFAARFDIPTAHASYDALYADPDVDIVYVATPHSHHRHMTIAALDAGKHVLCEKAFALNAGQAREMIEAARRNDRFLMEAMWTWFIPAIVDIKRRIAAGEIGRVVTIDSDFDIRIDEQNGRHRRADLAGGALLDLGIYPLSFSCFLLGEHPDEIKTVGRLTNGGVDATIGGVASFPTGTIATFQTSIDAFSGLGARIVGTEGRIEVDAPFWCTSGFTILRIGHDPERIEVPSDGLAHEAAHMMSRIDSGHRESDVIDLASTLRTMEMLDDVRAQIGVVYPEESRPEESRRADA